MMISTKGRYALRIMLDLASHREEGCVSLKTIAERQNTSMKYLEAIIAVLQQKGLVHSQRGKTGGYYLQNDPSSYTVWQILNAVENNLAPVACLSCEEGDCTRADYCLTLPMWKQLDRLIGDYLASVTLTDLINQSLPNPCAACTSGEKSIGELLT